MENDAPPTQQTNTNRDENSDSVVNANSSGPETPEEIKRKRRDEIFKELENAWVAKNGPSERALSAEEIRYAQGRAEFQKKKWDGHTTTLTDAFSEYYFDLKGNQKNSVPKQADRILAERFPEYIREETISLQPTQGTKKLPSGVMRDEYGYLSIDVEKNGSNARKISSTFKKNLNVRPRAVTGSTDERNPNVLNLRSEPSRAQNAALEENTPDIFDEKVIESTEQSKKRIDEDRLRESGPDDTEEAIAAAEQIYEEENLAINQELIASLKQDSDYITETSAAPQFPVLMFTFAIMKDVFDFFLTIGIETVVLLIIAEIFSALFGIAIFTWLLTKSQTKNRKLFKKQVNGAIGTVIVEQIPVIQVLPMEALFVYWTYFKEMKEYRSQQKASERLKELNIVRK